MKTYEYSLTFRLPASNPNPDDYLDILFEAGCDDALIGLGTQGSIAIDFTRLKSSASKAVHSAINQVKMAIPGVELLEVKPDLVGLSDIAELVNCSRQNIRKLAVDSKVAFPQPSVSGSVPLWHFFEVGRWLMDSPRIKSKPTEESIEISKIAFKLNMAVQHDRFEKCVAEDKSVY